MRKRPLIILSTIAAATLLLAGCSGSAASKPTSSSSPKPTVEAGCALDAKSGATSDAVKVEGSGADAKVTVPADAAFAGVERTVVAPGKGKDVKAGNLVSIRYQVVDGKTSKVLETSAAGKDGVLPILLDAKNSSLFVAALECEPLGSRIVLALPAKVLGEGGTDIVVYAEAVERLPEVATGTPVEPTPGMPEVKLDKSGAPTITIPKGDAPTETKVALLKQGDGATVGDGDLVVVQYRGVKWSDGKEFDSSWGRDATPAQFKTNEVVKGFGKALVGQKVGSQVVVVMPPKDGYGDSKDSELKDETLVFVVDILSTLKPPAAQ